MSRRAFLSRRISIGSRPPPLVLMQTMTLMSFVMIGRIVQAMSLSKPSGKISSREPKYTRETYITSIEKPLWEQCAPLQPLSTLFLLSAPLAESAAGLTEWRILLIVTSVNSSTQRVLVYLGVDNVSTQLATSDEGMLTAAEVWNPQIIFCPFLTRRIPEAVFKNVSFLSLGVQKLNCSSGSRSSYTRTAGRCPTSLHGLGTCRRYWRRARL